MLSIKMSWRWQLLVKLALAIVSLRYVNARSDFMVRQNISYATDEVVENIAAKSTLQCASRCSFVDDCVAIEFQEDNSTCVVIKSATRTNTALTDAKQYMKPVCDADWSQLNKSCYIVTSSAHNRTACTDICSDYGSHLVTVTSEEESDFVVLVKNGTSIWIGGMKISLYSSDGVWDTGEEWHYTNWTPNQPNNAWGNEYCIHYYASSPWGDMPCTELHNCLCEKELP